MTRREVEKIVHLMEHANQQVRLDPPQLDDLRSVCGMLDAFQPDPENITAIRSLDNLKAEIDAVLQSNDRAKLREFCNRISNFVKNNARLESSADYFLDMKGKLYFGLGPVELRIQATRLKSLIKVFFGPDSGYIADVDSISLPGVMSDEGEEDVRSLCYAAINMLKGIIDNILTEITITSMGGVANKSATALSNVVFVVHGHDEGMKQATARMLSSVGLQPVILNEVPNSGKTLLEKLEGHNSVGYAVVLVSPDDCGYSHAAGPSMVRDRPRQNVILELGYFMGSLGRKGVMVLKKGGAIIEWPSDLAGVVTEDFDESGAWKLKIASELKSRGYQIDANRLIGS